jgi:hypothetical protein
VIRLCVRGIGLLGPGLIGWDDESRARIIGERRYAGAPIPAPEAALLPPNERRRSSAVVRYALTVAEEAVRNAEVDARGMATVFACSGGEYQVLDRLCSALASPDRMISPTLFHHSVHNAAAGYFGIATASMQPATALACYDATFAAGLIEAAAQVAVEARPVLLVAYDLPPPPPLYPARPLAAPFAIALLLDATEGPAGHARLGLRLHPSTGSQATRMADPGLEALRLGNPAARALPLLAAIARGLGREVVLDYLEEDQRLVLEVSPCCGSAVRTS